MKHSIIIDWVSFSCPVVFTHWTQWLFDVIYSLDEHLPGAREIIRLDNFDRRAGLPARRPYRSVWVNQDNGLHLHFNPDLPHILVEASGKACQMLREQGTLMSLLNVVQPRLTRLDVALDMETNMSPLSIANVLAGAPTRAKTQISSDLGETLYVGSPKSTRFVRVYRYNPPHPRAGILRIEFVARHAFAKTLAKAISQSGLESVAMALLAKYHLDEIFGSDITAAENIDLSVPAEAREHAKTLFWLNRQVAPALIRLARAGALNPQEWLDKEVLSKLDLTSGGAPANNWE